MGISYHPDLGEALWCDYTGIKPEMVKRRLAVVVTPRACQRAGLATVIPISCTPPEVTRPWHVKLSRDPYPKGNKEEVWAKRSEEHTSELQSLMRISYAVFCLKKK